MYCPRASDLAIHAWDDGVVVYDDVDGSLHALSPVAGEALCHLISHGPTGMTSLARTLMQEEPSAEDVSMVANLIGEFESMRFVERISE